MTAAEHAYSLLNMRSAEDDLNNRARIRDAAIRRFASDGLDAPLRSIAADAGVSPGLILHHFGSRAGLRAACDAYVISQTRENKSGVLAGNGAPGAALLAQLAQIEGYAPLIGYLLRCLQAGGELTETLVDSFVNDAVGYMAEATRAGSVTESRAPEARARVLVEMSLGALLLQLPAKRAQLDLNELPHWLRSYTERIMLPVLELYTQPLLTDSTLLDAYLESMDRSTK